MRFSESLHGAYDQRYTARNHEKARAPNNGSVIDRNGVFEYGALVELAHPNDEVSPVTMSVFTEMFRSVRCELPPLLQTLNVTHADSGPF